MTRGTDSQSAALQKETPMDVDTPGSPSRAPYTPNPQEASGDPPAHVLTEEQKNNLKHETALEWEHSEEMQEISMQGIRMSRDEMRLLWRGQDSQMTPYLNQCGGRGKITWIGTEDMSLRHEAAYTMAFTIAW